ncbi:MAG TPA: hypothetical protein VGO31_14620 [Microbacteriaceae bacterium]|jgi:hypothetical protein|nr:hypothetical protein [Microbacteriaceae bacterium]
MQIRSDLRAGEGTEPEIWANVGDILDWLDTLPQHTDNRVVAAVSTEIREMLFSAVANAELVESTQGVPWSATTGKPSRFGNDGPKN